MLIKRGKLYEVPPSDGRDIKELFLYAVERGIGQIVDSKGIPKNKWTPNTLANAISEIDHPDASVDLRTVQYWFDSKNKRNISTTNCRWLAQIFGCGSPDEISDWQTALLSARRVFIEGRNCEGGSTSFEGKESQRVETADVTRDIGPRTKTTKQGFSENPMFSTRTATELTAINPLMLTMNVTKCAIPASSHPRYVENAKYQHS
ncbi:hypothetical protein [Loktanella sp. Alg231-35]|uniref:hypothetical protein n=1 Tax=Loktanella sp. Alg231-35 TaxID=1922220 RepID=UPI000D550A42|nr:hypothetical protein [Loktanella sp. Alg231-35]